MCSNVLRGIRRGRKHHDVTWTCQNVIRRFTRPILLLELQQSITMARKTLSDILLAALFPCGGYAWSYSKRQTFTLVDVSEAGSPESLKGP
jgi:hypothetical protein